MLQVQEDEVLQRLARIERMLVESQKSRQDSVSCSCGHGGGGWTMPHEHATADAGTETGTVISFFTKASHSARITQKMPDLVRLMLRERSIRNRHFESDLLSDPVWNMLLDLMRAASRGERICVSSLCLASGVPDTTAMRYIALMEERGLVRRNPDPTDRRRVIVELSDKGLSKISAFLKDFALALGQELTR